MRLQELITRRASRLVDLYLRNTDVNVITVLREPYDFLDYQQTGDMTCTEHVLLIITHYDTNAADLRRNQNAISGHM